MRFWNQLQSIYVDLQRSVVYLRGISGPYIWRNCTPRWAIQRNLLLHLEFIPWFLSQLEACYDLSQPCKSLGFGLPEDKRSLFLQAGVVSALCKIRWQAEGSGLGLGMGCSSTRIKAQSICLREMPHAWTYVPGIKNLVPGIIPSIRWRSRRLVIVAFELFFF